MAIESKAALQAEATVADMFLNLMPSGFSFHFAISTSKVLHADMLAVEATLSFSRWKKNFDGTILRTGPNNTSAWLIRR